MRKLRRAAEASVQAIEGALQSGERDTRCSRRQRRCGGAGLERLHRVHKAATLIVDRGALRLVRRSDSRQQIDEAGQAVALVLRKIRAGEERLAGGSEEDGERPTAGAARKQRVRRLADLVEIGALLAIDLHVDEVRIHDRSDVRVLERFVRHNVAPVARGIADGHEQRLVLGPGTPERFVAPRIPVDRILRVLREIGACC